MEKQDYEKVHELCQTMYAMRHLSEELEGLYLVRGRCRALFPVLSDFCGNAGFDCFLSRGNGRSEWREHDE